MYKQIKSIYPKKLGTMLNSILVAFVYGPFLIKSFHLGGTAHSLSIIEVPESSLNVFCPKNDK